MAVNLVQHRSRTLQVKKIHCSSMNECQLEYRKGQVSFSANHEHLGDYQSFIRSIVINGRTRLAPIEAYDSLKSISIESLTILHSLFWYCPCSPSILPCFNQSPAVKDRACLPHTKMNDVLPQRFLCATEGESDRSLRAKLRSSADTHTGKAQDRPHVVSSCRSIQLS